MKKQIIGVVVFFVACSLYLIPQLASAKIFKKIPRSRKVYS